MRLRELREEKKLTQEQLGKIIGQTKSNISKYERGELEPNLQTLSELSEIFDVSLDYLIGKSNIRKLPSNVCNENNELSEQEMVVIQAYRLQPDLQFAIQKLLGIEGEIKSTQKKDKDMEIANEIMDHAEEDFKNLLKSSSQTHKESGKWE